MEPFIVDLISDETSNSEAEGADVYVAYVMLLSKLKNQKRFIFELFDINATESKKKQKYYVDRKILFISASSRVFFVVQQINNILSVTHRVKERIWQSILLILKNKEFLSKACESDLDEIFQSALKAMINDEQSSVSAIQQLVIVHLLTIESKLWNICLEFIHSFGDAENSGMSVSISGLLIIGYLYGIYLANNIGPSKSASFLIKFLGETIRLQQSNNFVVRIYSIGLTQSVFTWFSKQDALIQSRLSEAYPFLEKHVSFSKQITNGNVGRNVKRVLDNPFLTNFDPVNNLSSLGIFHFLPNVFGSKTALNLDRIGAIREVMSIKFRDETFDIDVPLTVNETGDNNENEVRVSDESAAQEKIKPWMLDSQVVKQSGGMIVCCSLIDKANNLGGITRTAEIFSVSELTFDNLKVLSDKNYTSLAVTATKWIKISEVKRSKMIDWFMKVKKKGYCLVGLEQTTNSVQIQHFQFPEKCALVLGNEKEGIPMDLIPYFDSIVEIPQRH